MLHNLNLTGLLFAFLQLHSLTAAWPWPPSLDNLEGLIVRRQDTESINFIKSSHVPISADSFPASESAKATATPQASKTAAKASATNDDSTITSAPASSSGAAASKGSEDTKASSGASKTNDEASKTSKKASKTPVVDPRLAPGGIKMLTPAVTAATTYYKVGDMVTFGWNYTSLSVPPAHIDVYVTCTANSATYTIANNATYKPTGKAVWNTSEDATGAHPLLTEKYTLIIHDADKEVTAVASAGYLGNGKADEFSFGMYTPQPYVDKDSKPTYT